MDKCSSVGKGYRKTFVTPSVRRPLCVQGGLSQGEHILKSMEVDGKTFVEVLQYADWLAAVAAGQNRKAYPFKDSELWSHFHQALTRPGGGNQEDVFAEALEVDNSGSKRKRNCDLKLSDLKTISVTPPDDEHPILFLDNGTESVKQLWVGQAHLPRFLTLLAQDTARTQGHTDLEANDDELNSPLYMQGSRKWVVRWRTPGGALQDCTIIVDNRKRKGKVHVGTIDAESFLMRKKHARCSVKKKARDLGCDGLSDSDDGARDGGASEIAKDTDDGARDGGASGGA